LYTSTIHPSLTIPSLFNTTNKHSYVSPEGAYGTVLDWHAADAWSLGICLYIMLTARPLYSHPDDRAFEILVCDGAPSLLHHYATVYGLTLPEGAAELITALLRPDPIDRPTIEEVLMHPWVRPALGAGWAVGLQLLRVGKGVPETEAGMEEQ
jgi:serine/threonine protein kinase